MTLDDVSGIDFLAGNFGHSNVLRSTLWSLMANLTA